MMGDALGVLHDARKMRAHDPVLNEIMAELALVVAPLGQDIRTLHVWTQRNQTCDALSWLPSGTVGPRLYSKNRDARNQLCDLGFWANL